MNDLIYKLFFFLKRLQKKRVEDKKAQQLILQKLINRIEWFYNVVVREWFIKHPSEKKGLNRLPRKEKIIVSLTSFPKRIDTVWLTIETLLRQSVKPDKIILWLAESQFVGIDSLPGELLNLQKRGLSIRFCDDLRSHKKYYYVMQEYLEDIVVLVDDDMFYPPDMLSKLLKMHRKYPMDICTMTAEVIEEEFLMQPSMWRNPRLNERFEHSNQVQIFTGSGSLYPPHSLDESAFDKKLIRKLCPFADDLWLTFMAKRKGTKITAEVPWRAFPITIYGTAEGSLWYVNAEEGKNDEQWQNILNYFEEHENDCKNY